jgi:hypothetical protein
MWLLSILLLNKFWSIFDTSEDYIFTLIFFKTIFSKPFLIFSPFFSLHFCLFHIHFRISFQFLLMRSIFFLRWDSSNNNILIPTCSNWKTCSANKFRKPKNLVGYKNNLIFWISYYLPSTKQKYKLLRFCLCKPSIRLSVLLLSRSVYMLLSKK